MTRLIPVLAVLAACIALPAHAVESDADKKDHDALRALLTTFTEAFNTRNLEPLLPHLHKDFSVTLINQDVVTNPGELKAYLDKQFSGPAALLTDVKINPEPDIRTVFLEGRIGINRGNSIDTYTLKDGRVITLNTRWTGTAIKQDDQWKVLNAHIGLNILDNPILDAMEQMKWMWAGGGALIGLVLGVLIGRRRRR